MSPDPPRRAYKHGAVRAVRTGPLGGNIADSQSLDRYAYVFNDPLQLTDPLGTTPGNAGPGVTCMAAGRQGGTDVAGASGCGYGPTEGGGGWGGSEGGWGGGCTLDVGDVGCGMLGYLVTPGTAAECPNDNCTNVFFECSSFYLQNYSRLLEFVCNGESADQCSLTHDWLSWIDWAGDRMIVPLDPAADRFVGTAEDQQVRALANAVVQKAGYLND